VTSQPDAYDETDQTELDRRAQSVVAVNKYVTLATVDPDGHPWISPVFFTPDGGRRFLWASSPESLHSRNIAQRPDVSLVVFDSSVRVGGAEAVYARAVAGVVADEELPAAAELYSSRLPEQRAFSVEDLRADLRLYEAVIEESWVLVRGGDPTYGSGIDRRVAVRLA
jgi:hypothetical protein